MNKKSRNRQKNVNLLEGSIAGTLARLAFPIMCTSFIQMAYNLTDMIWIGRVSSNAVAAVGAAGMYLWLANGFSTIPRIGGQVRTAHAIGAGEREKAMSCAQAAFHMGIVMLLVCTLVYVFGSHTLIAFFQLNQESVVLDAETYLVITGLGLCFSFLNQIFTGLFTAIGKSMVMFQATTTGLIVNIALDPLLIFGAGPLPRLGVAGAALATVLAQAVVCLMFVRAAGKDELLFQGFHICSCSSLKEWKSIGKIGLPVAVQNILFSSLSMIIARMIASWGDAAVAVQKVGSQIESISWMTAEGFATAVNAFTAQNHGAQKKERVRKGYATAAGLMVCWGLFTSFVLMVLPEQIFRIFITDPAVLPLGVDYLRILGVSQLFMCLEITSAGAFQGLGKPMLPSVAGILGNAARVPLAAVLSATVLGLNGIWWSITISSIAKGVVVVSAFLVMLRKYMQSERKDT
ncbi:MAG: MATE family efflux transporter [Lachnospiraceae bacterium]|nr:MATE family efflux transporter [Lachnospiraceae bacterium]